MLSLFLLVLLFSTSGLYLSPSPKPPLKIINERYQAFSWVAVLIQVFIAISVTVSFLVMGSAMKHTSESNMHLPLNIYWKLDQVAKG